MNGRFERRVKPAKLRLWHVPLDGSHSTAAAGGLLAGCCAEGRLDNQPAGVKSGGAEGASGAEQRVML